MLKCCALLASSAIPEYLLQKFWEMQGNFDKTFEGDIKCMTNFALLSPVTHTGDVRSYQMHRLVQESIRGFRICGQNEIQCLVDKISHCSLYHFPSRDAIVQGIDLADRNLSVWIAHLNAISLLVQELHITKGNPEDLFELTRTVAITIKDLPWAMKLNVASVQRAVSTRMSNKEIASRLIDEATCFYNMKQYTECKETISKAREYIDELVFEDSRWSWSFTVRRDVLAWAASCQELMMKPPALTAEMSQLCQLQIGFTNCVLTIATFYSDQFVEIAEALQEDLKKILLLCVEAFGTDFPQAAVNAYIQIRLSDWSFQRAVEAFQPVLSEAGVRLNFGVICQKAKGAYGSYWSNLLKCFPSPENSLITVTYLRSFGEFLQVMDECERAEIVYKKALNVGLEIFHKDHIIIGEIQEQLGDCYKSLGRDAQAATCYSEALEIAAKSTTIDSSNAQIQRKYAKALVSSDPDKARGLFEEAVSISTGMDEFAANIDLAEFYCSQEMYSKALSILHEANDKHAYSCIDINECVQLLPMAFTDIQQSLVRSRCFLGLGDYNSLIKEVEPFIAPSSDLRNMQSMFPSVGEYIGNFHLYLAQCFCQQCDHIQCEARCRDAIENYANCIPRQDNKRLAAIALWTRSYFPVVECEDRHQILDSVAALEDIRRPTNICDVQIKALQEIVEFLPKSENTARLREELQKAMSDVREWQYSKQEASLQFFPCELVGATSDDPGSYDMVQSVQPQNRNGERVSVAGTPVESRRETHKVISKDQPTDPASLEWYKISPIDSETYSNIISSRSNTPIRESTISSRHISPIVISRSTTEQGPYDLPIVKTSQALDLNMINGSGDTMEPVLEAVSVTKDIPANPTADLDTSSDEGIRRTVTGHQIHQRGEDLQEVTLELTSHSSDSGRHVNNELIGQHEQLRELISIFQPSAKFRKFGMVVLHGDCGIGKTFLAKMYVEVFGSKYPDGIVWVSAESTLSIHHSICKAIVEGGFGVFNRFAEDLQSFQIMASQQQSMLIICDNADLKLVEAYVRPIVGTVHILVITRRKELDGFWTSVPNILLKPLTVDQSVQLMTKNVCLSRGPLSREDYDVLKDMIEQDMTGGLPLEVVYCAKKFCIRLGNAIADSVALLKKRKEQARQQISTPDGWLEFYHLSHLKTKLTAKDGVLSLSDIRSLSHSQVYRLGLPYFDQWRLKNGILRLGKSMRLPLWELDIIDMSGRNDDSIKLLHYCALLSPAPIPEYLLRECLKAHVMPLSDDRFHKAIAELTDLGLISPELNNSSTGNKCYTLPCRIQQLTIRYHLPDTDVQKRLSVLTQVVGGHLPPLKDINTLTSSMDPFLSELRPHVQALAKTLEKINVLDPSCRKIFSFIRVVAVTIKDPELALHLCQQCVERAISVRFKSELVASHVIDLALRYAERNEWNKCLQNLHEANSTISQIQNPQVSLVASVRPLQWVVFMNQIWFRIQFGEKKASEMFLSVKGFGTRLISLLAHYSLVSSSSHVEEIVAIVQPTLLKMPFVEFAAQMWPKLDQLGAVSTEQVFSSMGHDINNADSVEKLVELDKGIEANFRTVSGLFRQAWKRLLGYDAATKINLQTLDYWQSCAEYLCSMNQPNKALFLYKQMLHILQGCLPPGHPSIGETLKRMGDCCRLEDNLPEAFEYYSQAVTLLSSSNQDSLQLAMFFTNLAKSCAMSKPQLAEKKLKEALTLCEQIGDQLMVHAAKKKLAKFYFKQKQYDRAVQICQTVERQVIGQVSTELPGNLFCFAINTVKISNVLICCLKETGEYQTAIDKSKVLFSDTNQEVGAATIFASGRAVLGDACVCIGDCLLAENLVQDALSRYHEALEFYEDSVGWTSPKMIAGLVSVARLHLSCERTFINMGEILNSVDALMKVTKLKELVQCHTKDVDNLASLFASVHDQDASQLAREVSMAVSEYVKHKTISPPDDDDDDLLADLHLTQQQPQTDSLNSIEKLPMGKIRDLLAWSCSSSRIIPVQESSDIVDQNV
jgi:tetratricopeptide (TPR) repeat protein